MSEEMKSEELTETKAEETIENAEDKAADNTGSAEDSSKENDKKSTGKTAEEPEAETPKSKLDYEEAYHSIYKDLLEHLRSFSPTDEIAYRITEEHITEYLEGRREEKHQEYKERRDKRLLPALKLIAILVCIVLIVWFLKDSQAILVNILYIIGGLIALWIWKYPHNKDE